MVYCSTFLSFGSDQSIGSSFDWWLYWTRTWNSEFHSGKFQTFPFTLRARCSLVNFSLISIHLNAPKHQQEFMDLAIHNERILLEKINQQVTDIWVQSFDSHIFCSIRILLKLVILEQLMMILLKCWAPLECLLAVFLGLYY